MSSRRSEPLRQSRRHSLFSFCSGPPTHGWLLGVEVVVSLQSLGIVIPFDGVQWHSSVLIFLHVRVCMFVCVFSGYFSPVNLCVLWFI